MPTPANISAISAPMATIRWTMQAPPRRAHGRRIIQGPHTKPAFFRSPVHCVKIADDGKIYVCDRGNDRIQVFDGKDPIAWAIPAAIQMAKPESVASWRSVGSANTPIPLPVMPGTAVSMNFSTDKAQSCLYVGDNTNQTIYILNRSNLQELGRLGQCRPNGGRFPLAAPGQRGRSGQYLYGGSRYRKAHPEVHSLREYGLQRYGIWNCWWSLGNEIEPQSWVWP